MDNIRSKGYAKFMEETLKGMVQLPVEGICVITKLKDGSVFTNYFNSSMLDKVTYAGIIQQDAMIETLTSSRLIGPKNEDQEE